MCYRYDPCCGLQKKTPKNPQSEDTKPLPALSQYEISLMTKNVGLIFFTCIVYIPINLVSTVGDIGHNDHNRTPSQQGNQSCHSSHRLSNSTNGSGTMTISFQLQLPHFRTRHITRCNQHQAPGWKFWSSCKNLVPQWFMEVSLQISSPGPEGNPKHRPFHAIRGDNER